MTASITNIMQIYANMTWSEYNWYLLLHYKHTLVNDIDINIKSMFQLFLKKVPKELTKMPYNIKKKKKKRPVH